MTISQLRGSGRLPLFHVVAASARPASPSSVSATPSVRSAASVGGSTSIAGSLLLSPPFRWGGRAWPPVSLLTASETLPLTQLHLVLGGIYSGLLGGSLSSSGLSLLLLPSLLIDQGHQPSRCQTVPLRGVVHGVLPPDLFLMEVAALSSWRCDQLAKLHYRGSLDIYYPYVVSDNACISDSLSSIYLP